MPLTLRFLGTAASRPTVERNVSAIAVVRDGETLMFDCGEGTQRQMMRYGVSFVPGDIFFTHFHTDHVLGVIGLLRTMQMQGRTEPLRIWGPPGATRFLQRAEIFGAGDRLGFPVTISEVVPGVPSPEPVTRSCRSRRPTDRRLPSATPWWRRSDSADSTPIGPASSACPKDPCGEIFTAAERSRCPTGALCARPIWSARSARVAGW